jgi:hypothetical protein
MVFLHCADHIASGQTPELCHFAQYVLIDPETRDSWQF